jgi:hypothetical protein
MLAEQSVVWKDTTKVAKKELLREKYLEKSKVDLKEKCMDWLKVCEKVVMKVICSGYLMDI